ncbi:MAG TPA: hypothetical protein VJ960_00285 [Oceanipulchritudo sp.]|nr:hypothetical protein [Oceanipulchritudo sp.]
MAQTTALALDAEDGVPEARRETLPEAEADYREDEPVETGPPPPEVEEAAADEEPLLDLETAVKQISPALREEMATLLKAEFRTVIRLERPLPPGRSSG